MNNISASLVNGFYFLLKRINSLMKASKSPNKASGSL